MKKLIWIRDLKENHSEDYYNYLTERANKNGIELIFYEDDTLPHIYDGTVLMKRSLTDNIREKLKCADMVNTIDSIDVIKDKIKTKEIIQEALGSEYVLKTYYDKKDVDKFPVLIKPIKGMQGNCIKLINTKEELDETDTTDMLIEEYGGTNPNKSLDYRAYVLNQEILLFIRKTNDGLVSNAAKGGRVHLEPTELTEDVLFAIEEVAGVFRRGYYAIDFLIKDNEVKILELNSNPCAKYATYAGLDYYSIFFEKLSKSF